MVAKRSYFYYNRKVLNSLKNKAYQTLRGSEGFFKADMVYLAKGSFWQTFGQALSGLGSLILLIAFTNLLPKETYGMYKYLLSLAGILGIFTLTGMNRSVIQAVAAGFEGALKSAVQYQLKWNLLMFGAFLALSVYYFINENTNIAISLLVMGFSIPLVHSFNSYGAYLEGKKQFRLNNIFGVLSVLTYLVGMFITLLLSREALWLIFTYCLTTTLTTIFFYYQTLKLIPPTNVNSGEVLKYGRQLTFIGFIGPITAQIDNIIIAHFWGATQLAVYAVASAIPSRAVSFIKSLVDIGYPNLVGKNEVEIERVYLKRIFQGLSIGLAISIIYILLAPYLFYYLMPQYTDSIFYSQIMSLALIPAMAVRYHGALAESKKISSLIFTNSVIQNVVRIGLYIILGIWGGVVGLALVFALFPFISLAIHIGMWRFYVRSKI